MKLGEYGDAEVHRNGKVIAVRFRGPHRVISTAAYMAACAMTLSVFSIISRASLPAI